MDPSSISGPGNNTTDVGSSGYQLPDMTYRTDITQCVRFGTDYRVYSFGYFSGELPFMFPFPVLMLQIAAIMFLTRLVYYLLRPLKQPRIVCDVIGGLLLSPSVLGLIELNVTDGAGTTTRKSITDLIYPARDFQIIRSVAGLGIMFYLFLVGVKIDLKMLVSSGRKSLAIGIVSFVVPFVSFGFACFALEDQLNADFIEGRFLVFILASVSITSFPVLADILTELHLLNSELGRLAMSSAMVQGLIGFMFMSIFIAINQGQGGWEKSLWSLLSLAAVIMVIVYAFRPWMLWIVRKTPKGGRIDEKQIFAIFITMIAMGIISDFIGASFVFAPFIMGLAVPDGPPLGAVLVEKAQLLAGEGLMPLLFGVSGISANLIVLKHWRKWVALALVLTTGYVAKVMGTMAPAIYCNIHVENAFLLGLMMNFRGMVEVLTLLNFKAGALFSDEIYTLFLLLTILGTGVAVPIVSALYNPLATGYNLGRRTIQNLKTHSELRVLACLKSEHSIPSILNLLEASSPSNEMPLCVYVLHWTELEGRANSSLIAHKNKKGFINPSQMDRLHNTFINYEQSKMGQVAVQPFTSITPVKTMHHDVCSLAVEKNVALVVVPFQRKDEGGLSDVDQSIRNNIPDILAQAPCSVGILVVPDIPGPMPQASRQFQHQIAVLFWGGPDDREALAYASRMVHRSGVTVTVFQFVVSADRRDNNEQKLDENMLTIIQYENSNNSRLTIEEVVVNDVEQTIKSIKSIAGGGYNLLLVGRKQGANSLADEQLAEWSEYPELGVVGDILACKDTEASSVILVVQQQI